MEVQSILLQLLIKQQSQWIPQLLKKVKLRMVVLFMWEELELLSLSLMFIHMILQQLMVMVDS